MKNILFIMADQLRFDYLGCYGHPTIRTPNIDALAARGVRFDRAYVQSPICGPSRMSFYTGRYVRSHGSTWNNVPLRVGEMTLGDHLRPFGMQTVLCGKTHMEADREGMARLGLDPESVVGARVAEGGFDVWDRLDGLHPSEGQQPSHYQDHLRGMGYGGPNPWEQWANSAEGDDGEILSGWLMRHADRPARINEPDSETPYATTRAIEFIEQAGDAPWCLHLSYIKPHWPYIVPAPYHAMYGARDVLPAVRSETERETAGTAGTTPAPPFPTRRSSPAQAGRSTGASSSASGTRQNSPRRDARAGPETDRPHPRRAEDLEDPSGRVRGRPRTTWHGTLDHPLICDHGPPTPGTGTQTVVGSYGFRVGSWSVVSCPGGGSSMADLSDAAARHSSGGRTCPSEPIWSSPQ